MTDYNYSNIKIDTRGALILILLNTYTVIGRVFYLSQVDKAIEEYNQRALLSDSRDIQRYS